MKSNPVIQLVWCIVLLVPQAHAQLVAYESFTGLTIGDGVSGTGTDSYGWSSGWTGEGVSDARLQIVSPVPSLSYQVSGGGSYDGGNRALQLSTAPEPVPVPLSIQRTFPNQNTTMYLSFLMRFPASGTGSDQIDVNFLSGNSIIRTIRFKPSNPSPPVGSWAVLLNGNGQGSTISGDSLTTHLVVFQVIPSSGFAYWIDPVYGGYNSPKSSGYGGVPAVFDGISMNIASTDSAGPTTTVILDEFRLGYTWSDVVLPPPAPSVVPDVLIHQAVNLRWQSVGGKTYQVQYSYDLTTWFNFGSSISGDGQVKEAFDSTNTDTKKFYRIQVQ